MPEFAVDPGDASDEAIGFDRAQHLSRFGVHLMDLAAAMLPDPQRAFRPGKAGIASFARRRDRGKHFAALRIDLPDHRLCDLEQVLAIERRARIGSKIERARHLPAVRIKSDHLGACRHPDPVAIKAHPMDAIHSGKGTIFTNDFGGCVFHVLILADNADGGE
jgi:hypothetical protein